MSLLLSEVYDRLIMQYTTFVYAHDSVTFQGT